MDFSDLSMMVPVKLDLSKAMIGANKVGGSTQRSTAFQRSKPMDLSSEFWKDAITSGLKSLIKQDPGNVIDFGVESLLGWVFGDESEGNPTLLVLEEIDSKLNEIVKQLELVMEKLDEIMEKIIMTNYRTDLANATSIRDLVQQRNDDILIEFAVAKEEAQKEANGDEALFKEYYEGFCREIVKNIIPVATSDDIFFTRTRELGDALIRVDNVSKKSIFRISETLTRKSKLLWDH